MQRRQERLGRQQKQRRQRTTPIDRAAAFLTARAQDAEERGDLAEAERVCARVLEEVPAYPQARLVLARVRARTGRIDDAIATFRDLIARNPGFDAARLALVGALFLTGAHSEALDHLQRLARRSGGDRAEFTDTTQHSDSDTVLAPLWESYIDRKGLR